MADAALAVLDPILRRNGVSIAKPQDFTPLHDFDVVLILDDSSSMTSRSGKTTRWGELQETASQLIEIACCFDSDGIDVYFLNGGKIPNITSGNDARLVRRFRRGPSGGTPLTETLQAALRDHQGNKPLLITILSDGEPRGGALLLKNVIEESIRASKGRIRYQLMACTDNDRAVAWMDDLDVRYAEVDATDDFHTERAQVLKAGFVKGFERGDWIAKALLGAISKKWNSLDDRAHAHHDDESTAASTADDALHGSEAVLVADVAKHGCNSCSLQ